MRVWNILGVAGLGFALACAISPSRAQRPAHKSSSPSASKSMHRAAPKPAERADVAKFRKRVEALLAMPGPDKGAWGILVADASTGESLYERDADHYFAPASNAKLFTTAFALATLGPEYRVRTSVVSNGVVDEHGVLNGDVILIGRGDANLSSRKFPYDRRAPREGPPEKALAEFADAIVARGVKEISGDIIADDSLFKSERFPSGWTIDDMQWSYGGAVSAIAINDNQFALQVWPGEREGDPARYEAGIGGDYYTIENLVRTSDRGSADKLAVTRDPGSRLIHLTGTMPAGAPPRRLSIAIEEPAEFCATVLSRLIEAHGVKIRGAARTRHASDPSLPVNAPAVQTVFAERTSPPISEDIVLTNKESENVHAELMLLVAAHEKSGAGDYEDALKFEAGFFRSAGIADGDVFLSDGSGLSRKDLVTPRSVVRMLRYSSTQPWGELYRSSLPVAGEDGTLSGRMKNTAAAGRIFAKTGTIGHVNAISGYATTLRGTHLVFSILGNNNNLRAQDADRVLDAIAVAMVEEIGK